MRGPIGMLLLSSTLAVYGAGSGPTLESRSQHHAITVDVAPEAHFKVRVVDLDTHETLFARELAGLPSEDSVDVRDLHITVRIGAAPYGIATTAEIEQGDVMIDSLYTVWTLAPHRARLRNATALRVGGEVKAPVIIKRVEPHYTDDARRDRIAGIVILEALVDRNGAVTDAIVLKGLPDGLSDAAIAAVRQWQCQPATLNGEPVDVIVNLTINFKPSAPQNE